MENKKKILIVEDDFMLRDIYKDTLEGSGFLVEIAVNGEECLEKINTSIPDLVLLDIFTPKLSGFEVIDRLKQNPSFSNIPIIVLTNVYIDREELVKKGVEHCLIKAEMTPGGIVEKVNDTLKSHQAKIS